MESRDDWILRRKLLNKSKYKDKSQHITNEELFSDFSKYPYINTWINTSLYIFFTTHSKNAKPKNYTSDFRHLICANATGKLVTRDERLINICKKVCPFIKVLHWDEFQKITNSATV